MKRMLSYLLSAVLLTALLAACQAAAPLLQESGSPDESAPGTATIKVVTTIFPPYDFVREIAGDNVELTMLLSPGAESHSFDPSPQDIIKIRECDLFLYAGGNSDQWVERILASVDTSDMVVLSLVDLVDAVEEELVEGMEHGHDHDQDDKDGHDDEDQEGHHEARELDEHVWTSPKNAMELVSQISDVLCELDPENAQLYRSNTTQYLIKLSDLDARYQQMVDGAARKTLIFGDRFPFRYLADAYGLTYYAAYPGCSTETEASTPTVAFLINKVREESLPVVFHIELSNEKMANAICESTGAKKLLLHSVHNVSRDDFQAGATYLSLMEQNLLHLQEALY